MGEQSAWIHLHSAWDYSAVGTVEIWRKVEGSKWVLCGLNCGKEILDEAKLLRLEFLRFEISGIASSLPEAHTPLISHLVRA